MKKILAVIVCLFCLAIEDAFSAQVAWMYVQHREYEDGRSLNRLSFGLTDENGQYLRNDDSVTDVKLYDPNGNTVNLPPHNFDSDEEMYGSYDGKNSQWHYGDDWRFVSWFSANLSVSLIPGIYRLKVTTDAVQVMGGEGYSREHPVEKMMRDAKLSMIYEGTNQVNRLVVSKSILK